MKSAVILLCLVVYCSAQMPMPCKSPEQWEARIFTSDRSQNFARYGKLTYDETNTRYRIIEEEQEGSMRSYYDTLYLHNIGREYRLDLKTRMCNVTTLTRPFRPFGVPPFAKFAFEAEIGAAGIPGESLIAKSFDGMFEDGTKFLITATSPDCVPVTAMFDSKEFGFVLNDFFDVNLGISDPMVFIPPRECTM